MGGDSDTPLEERSRGLFDGSVAGVDMRIRSRLTQARHAALALAPAPHARARFFGVPLWTAAAAAAGSAVLAVALWLSLGAGQRPLAPAGERPSFEDLDIVASSDGGSGNAMEMMQDDVEFYAWAAAQADRAAGGHAG